MGTIAVLFVAATSIVGVVGVRARVQAVRATEARAALERLAHLARERYEADGRLCPSATAAVPASMETVLGDAYGSTAADWSRDARLDAGFACLHFSLEGPQHFQYAYRSGGGNFVATARGELIRGAPVIFRVEGTIKEERLIVSEVTAGEAR